MRASTSGLARVTIRAPRRRVDLAIPYQIPLAELLPEVLRRAGETGLDPDATQRMPSGWMLRRGDGTSLVGDLALARQGVRDGDVLYLVPRNLDWPEPAYDDVVEEVAAGARGHGALWGPAATRLFALVAAGLVLLTGLGVLVAVGPHRTIPGLVAAAVAAALLSAGALLSRALGDGVAGAATAGLALPYAAASGVLLIAGSVAQLRLAPQHLLIGACALLLASVLGAIGVGHGVRVFVAGGTFGIFVGLGSLLGLVVGTSGAAAIVVVALVAGIGLAPIASVKLGKVPQPVVSASPDVIAAEARPERAAVRASAVRADEILAGLLIGISLAAVGSVAVLAAAGGVAAPLLGGLAAVALLLRARVFPAVATRLPLLAAGLVSLALTAAAALAAAGAATRLVGVTFGLLSVVALLSIAATAHRRRAGASPYLGRIGDILDVVAVIALAPVAAAVLDLYAWIRALAS
ncbi:MAG TPA: type VII secretion integral membrane protein EccD [Micromonosporaceae bacterium]|nr:type VII secretion integral membrane protein EccD [Micromonosporaceae bacterium]